MDSEPPLTAPDASVCRLYPDAFAQVQLTIVTGDRLLGSFDASLRCVCQWIGSAESKFCCSAPFPPHAASTRSEDSAASASACSRASTRPAWTRRSCTLGMAGAWIRWTKRSDCRI